VRRVEHLVVHVVAYLAVCTLLVLIWAMTSGSFEELGKIAEHPQKIDNFGFWPVWIIIGWGAGVVIHAGFVLATVPRTVLNARERRREERERQRRREATARMVSGSVRSLRDLGSQIVHRPSTGRRFVVVMFTDIAGSTPLAEEMGDEEWGRVLSKYRAIVRETFEGFGGAEVGTQGDGFLVQFDDPVAAVRTAIELQRALERPVDGSVRLPTRVGVHVGDALDEGDDLVGRVVNLAARVTAAAEPGEILVTEPVADQLGTEFTLEDRGLRPLKGVAQPRHLLAVRWKGRVARHLRSAQ
jgi:class 3 adenylate cyclase